MLAFSVGLVVEGLRGALKSVLLATAVTLVIALISVASILPHLLLYRRQPAPIVRVLHRLQDRDMAQSFVVADHTLASFIQLERLEGRWHHRLLWDYAVLAGMFRSAPRADLVAAWDGGRPSFITGGRVQVFAGDALSSRRSCRRVSRLSNSPWVVAWCREAASRARGRSVAKG